MADDSSVAPIWCDVGKNLNAAYLVVSLGHAARGRSTRDRNSNQTVKIYSQRLVLNSGEVSADIDGSMDGDKNVVLFPGECLFLRLSVAYNMTVSLLISWLRCIYNLISNGNNSVGLVILAHIHV